ncbi:hypothetical protein [uncultured Gammaproteobacteria bacterium]|nr:hypothetical protein [uncultured Gammaproteobacteria bacterium]
MEKENIEKKNMEKVLFCRIASMKFYQDIKGDIPQGGGSSDKEGNPPPHERFNFKDRDGVIKGFVQSGNKLTRSMNLSKIDSAAPNDVESIESVLVIFVAKGCIVGYYKDATVYRSIQDKKHYDQGDFKAYNIEVESQRAVLLSEESRTYEIPRGKGGMGQSNVCYIYDDQGLKKNEWIKQAINYVQINELVKSYISNIISFCQDNPNELSELTGNNFGTTSYPLLKTVEEIQENNQTLHSRYWITNYDINNQVYRFHSQWGGHKIWNGKNNSISLDEKHRNSFVDYLIAKGIYTEVTEGGTYEGEKMKEVILLEAKKQIILQGSPGTGKTRKAMEIAKEMAPDNYKLIQFHPAYTYEDFVRGIVATTDSNGNINYDVKNKVLAEMAENAKNNPANSFVLIIDEINRANLSSVLGELIYALEYRGEVVESMYEYKGSRKIVLPKNLYIIGTMNTADRSVGHIDYAIRRRFAFVDVNTDESVIPNKAKPLFKKVKGLFKEHLSDEFELNDVMIGHSYFLRDNLKLALEYEIKPMLQEYRKDGVLTCEKEKIEELKIEG